LPIYRDYMIVMMAAVCHVESTVPDLCVDHWRVSSFSQDLMLVVKTVCFMCLCKGSWVTRVISVTTLTAQSS